MSNLIEQSIIISFACVGLRIVSSKGMILYFLRMPYESLLEYLEVYEGILKKEIAKMKGLTLVAKETKVRILKRKTLTYLLKPIIGCITCMASVWTIVVSYLFFELSQWTILTIFIVAFLNSMFYALYNLMIKIKEFYESEST